MAIDAKELMARVGKIRILTNMLIDERLSGDYHSTFKGQGVEFDEVRPYMPGDDVRSIDWNVTARAGAPYIKRYCEERELTVLFMVDVSGSQSYGSSSRSKMQLSAELAALLALTAIRNQDKVGLVLFSDRIVKYIPPKKGRDAVMRLVREVLAAEDEANGKTDIAEALKFLNAVQKRRAVVFLVSDFMDAGFIEETGAARRMLRSASHHHDIICAHVSDPAEYALPDAGLVELEDPESGELMLVDTSNAFVREEFAKHAAQERDAIFKMFAKSGMDSLELRTDAPYIDSVRALFKRRAAKRK